MSVYGGGNVNSYFFTYETRLPQNVGFAIFGTWHVLWLVVLVLLSALVLWVYRRVSENKKRVWEHGIGFSMLLWIALRSVYIAVIGERFLYELPLHLCSLMGIFCALHCVLGWEWMGQVLYALGLPGAVLALLFPDWGRYPAIHFITIEGFFFHAEIIWYVVSQLYSRRIVPQRNKLWQVVVFLAVYMVPIYFFDRAYMVNYMFLSRPSAGSPMELLLRWFGDPGYLVAYVILILLCICLMCALYQFVTGRRKNNTNF